MDKMSLAGRILDFYTRLSFSSPLPPGVRIMNPFGDLSVLEIAKQFYSKFYSDNHKRYIILGINPGRFGAGSTGIPFTDTIRLNDFCGINFDKFRTYEPSSAFIYEMIGKFGGVDTFYKRFFVSAICPLGFTFDNGKGREVNYNYYDSPALQKSAYPFILETLQQQIDLGINNDICFCLGTGKNDAFLRKVNSEFHFFEKIITLEHPRYIMQYRAKTKSDYIDRYIRAFNNF